MSINPEPAPDEGYKATVADLLAADTSNSKVSPARFRQANLPEIIQKLVKNGTIARLIRESQALPPTVSHNIIHRGVIGGVIHEEANGDPEDFVNKRGNVAVNTPLRTHEGRVQELIRITAENIAKWLKTKELVAEERESELVDKLRIAINANVRRNLENMHKREMIYIREGVLKSPAQLAAAVKKISTKKRAGIVSKEEAIVALLWTLGAYTDAEINKCPRKKDGLRLDGYTLNLTIHQTVKPIETIADLMEFNLESLAEKAEDSLTWAKAFLDKNLLTERLIPLIARYAASGKLPETTAETPELNQALMGEDFFELLECLFTDHSSDERVANDLQMMTTLALCHWTYQQRRDELGHTHEIHEIEGKFSSVPYTDEKAVGDDTPYILAYDPALEEFRETAYKMGRQCRVWKASNEFSDIPHEQRLVNRTKVGVKEIPSCVIKHYNPDRDNRLPHEVPDEIRGRIVVWRVTSKQFRENKHLQNMYEEGLQELAKELELKEGWEVENDFDKDFSKMTLIGKTKKGINVEFQVFPIDTYQFDLADESGSNHKLLEELRELKYALTAIPYSLSPIIHKLINMRIAEIEEYRTKCFAAQKKHPHSSSPVPQAPQD